MRDLEHLLSAYFHQDWRYEHATWQEAVDPFSSDSPHRVPSIGRDIDSFLSGHQDDEQLRLALNERGSAYLPAPGEPAHREWLEEVRDYVAGVHR